MRPILLAALLVLALVHAPAFGQAESRGAPLGEASSIFLAGGSRGLYRAEFKGGEVMLSALREGGSVSLIQPSASAGGWYFIGLVSGARCAMAVGSSDLKTVLFLRAIC